MRLPLITAWQDRRDAAAEDRWDREHRWDELAAYNGRVLQGIVHTPEYAERMRRLQDGFDAAHGYIGQIDDGLTFTDAIFDYGTRRP